MKYKALFIGLALAGICAVSVQAQPGPPGMGHHHGPMMGGGPGRLIPLLLHATDLTSDQETQAHQILDAGHPAAEQIFTQLHQANKDLANLLLGQAVPAADAVAAQQAQIAQLQQQLAQQETSTVLALRAILTPDQLAKALAAQGQWNGKHGDKPCSGKGS